VLTIAEDNVNITLFESGYGGMSTTMIYKGRPVGFGFVTGTTITGFFFEGPISAVGGWDSGAGDFV
jgi:hypothetical protein